MRAASYAESVVAAEAVALAELGYLHGYLIWGGSAASTLIVYDGPVASGKEIGRAQCGIAGFASVQLTCPVRAHTSITFAVAGADAIGGVYYGK